MKITCKKTGKDMTSKVIQMIEKSWKDKGIKVVKSYTSDPDIRKGYKNSKI